MGSYRCSLPDSIALVLGFSLGACSTNRPPSDWYVAERSISFPQLDEPAGQFYRDYLARSDHLDPGEAAYAIKVAEQWLSRDNAVRAREFFETARQLLDNEKMLYQWCERRDPEGYHRGRVEVDAALF